MRLDQATTETEQTIIPNAVKRSSEMIHCVKGFKRSMVCISKDLKMIGTFVKYDNFPTYLITITKHSFYFRPKNFLANGLKFIQIYLNFKCHEVAKTVLGFILAQAYFQIIWDRSHYSIIFCYSFLNNHCDHCSN